MQEKRDHVPKDSLLFLWHNTYGVWNALSNFRMFYFTVRRASISQVLRLVIQGQYLFMKTWIHDKLDLLVLWQLDGYSWFVNKIENFKSTYEFVSFLKICQAEEQVEHAFSIRLVYLSAFKNNPNDPLKLLTQQSSNVTDQTQLGKLVFVFIAPVV